MLEPSPQILCSLDLHPSGGLEGHAYVSNEASILRGVCAAGTGLPKLNVNDSN